MKPNKLAPAMALAVFCGWTAPSVAQNSVSVDMDLGTPGIQNTRTVSPGDVFQIGLVLNVDAAGVSSFGISSLFNTSQLSLNGAPASAIPALPSGLLPLAAPVENNLLGRVYTFNGATFGLGPSSMSFMIGTIHFQVPLAATVLNDAVPDITLGYFNAGVDGMFDNSGAPVIPAFNPGLLAPVPEPGTWSLLASGLVAVLLFARRRIS